MFAAVARPSWLIPPSRPLLAAAALGAALAENKSLSVLKLSADAKTFTGIRVGPVGALALFRGWAASKAPIQ